MGLTIEIIIYLLCVTFFGGFLDLGVGYSCNRQGGVEKKMEEGQHNSLGIGENTKYKRIGYVGQGCHIIARGTHPFVHICV